MAIVKKIKKAVNGMVDTVGKAVYAKDVNSIAKDLQMKKKSIDSKKAELKSNFDKSQSKLKESFLAEKNKLPKDKMKSGGMLKRADGSMSKRGLWDNIRANKGSGKKPTAAMLKQEKKIKSKTK
mgnify:CR=1 FL=1